MQLQFVLSLRGCFWRNICCKKYGWVINARDTEFGRNIGRNQFAETENIQLWYVIYLTFIVYTCLDVAKYIEQGIAEIFSLNPGGKHLQRLFITRYLQFYTEDLFRE